MATSSSKADQPADRLLAALSTFACEVPIELDATARRTCEAAILDSIAVALGALSHPAAQAGRRFARHTRIDGGATIWGSGLRTTPEIAALVNAIPLRGYDYNDLYMGRSGGHPSDLIPGAIALAEWRGLPGRRLLGAIALGYEVALDLFDAIDLDRCGWDYPTITAIAATASFARLLELTPEQTSEAIAITAINHFVSDEVESGELNRRGDLTMWKRFNCGHAARQAVYACLLAEAGVEGAVRPFEGRSGFLSKVGMTAADALPLAQRFTARRRLARAQEVSFKRWPVGSRAQSAIQAALAARAGIDDPWNVAAIRIVADAGAYDHLVRRREAPFAPISRETADHSLPYIVAAAVLDGYIKVESFDPARVTEPRRLAFLASKVTAQPVEHSSSGAKGGFPTSVEIVRADGSVAVGHAELPPGHPQRPFTDADFEAKLHDNVAPVYGAAGVARIVAAVRDLHRSEHVRDLVAALVHPQPAVIDELAAA